MMFSSSRLRRHGAFTLVELMVATVVLVIILLMLVAMVNQTATIWRNSSTKIEQFRSARTAYESITRHLSQATLNTYYDYARDKNGNATKYIRQSDLRFVNGSTADLIPNSTSSSTHQPQRGPSHAIFFNAPLGFVSSDPQVMDNTQTPAHSLYAGLSNLLNTWGYFIEYGSDYNYRPQFLNNSGSSFAAPAERYRYRLMEFMVPSDQITLYHYTSTNTNSTYIGRDWYTDFLNLPLTAPAGSATTQIRPAHLLSENIITLVIAPQLSSADQKALQNPIPPATAVSPYIAPGYTYDTSPVTATGSAANPATDPTNQLPPVVQVTLIAMDEASALRMERGKSDPSQPPTDFDSTIRTSYFQTSPIASPQTGNSALNYDADLKALQDYLVSKNVAYRTFTSKISLRGAKWSRN